MSKKRFDQWWSGEIAELKKKLEEAVSIIELVDYQFCTSFGDAENIRNSVNKAREFLKEVKGGVLCQTV